MRLGCYLFPFKTLPDYESGFWRLWGQIARSSLEFYTLLTRHVSEEQGEAKPLI